MPRRIPSPWKRRLRQPVWWSVLAILALVAVFGSRVITSALPTDARLPVNPQPASVSVFAPVAIDQFDWRYQRDDAKQTAAVEPFTIAAGYTPPEEIIPADPSNYGPRYQTDIHGQPALYPLIVVLHETVGSADSAINLFQTYHPRDEDQVSYHSLIRRDGTIVHLVHPQMRAFGAGNSVFDGPSGPEAVQTNPDLAASVNNFAYHTSLETPADGRGNQPRHSGYTEAQYRSLAWLIAQLPVTPDRITTHRAVDRLGRKQDPRSFDGQRLLTLLGLG